MFKFKKLWASWFGTASREATPVTPPSQEDWNNRVVTGGNPDFSTSEVVAKMKMDAIIREAREDAKRRRKARRATTRYTPTAPTPTRPSDDAMDGSSGIGITEAIIMAEILSSDSTVTDIPVTNDTPPWEGGGGMSDGAGASGGWDSSDSCSYDSGSSSCDTSSFDSGSSDSGSFDSGSY